MTKAYGGDHRGYTDYRTLTEAGLDAAADPR